MKAFFLSHLDKGVRLGVEVQADGVAGLLGQHVRHHVRGVVSSHLDGADALGGGTVVVLDHDRRRRLKAALRCGKYRGARTDGRTDGRGVNTLAAIKTVRVRRRRL